MGKGYFVALLLLSLLLSSISSTRAYPQSLMYSDQIKKGRVYQWLRYENIYDDADSSRTVEWYNMTIEVIQSPAGVEHLSYQFDANDYFTLYRNSSIISAEQLLYWDQAPLIYPVIENGTTNHFSAEAAQSSTDNATIDDMIYSDRIEYTTNHDHVISTIEYYYQSGIVKSSHFMRTELATGMVLQEVKWTLVYPSAESDGQGTVNQSTDSNSDTSSESEGSFLNAPWGYSTIFLTIMVYVALLNIKRKFAN